MRTTMMRKKARTSLESAIVDVWEREIGRISNRNFAHRLAASEDLVLRLGFLRKLDKHRGCVNTVSFNGAGDILVSGSDDRRIILWDWERGQIKLSFHSGHLNNVFQAKIMPGTDDRSIVSCAADGQVRHAQILEHGKVDTRLLGKHQGRAHKLAIEPGSPHVFYTCGEDGLVQHIDLRIGTATGLFTCKPTANQSYLSVVHLNAIALDPRNPNIFAVGGSDQFARLYDIRKYKWDGSSEFDRPIDFFCPPHLTEDEHVGITGLAFSDQSELLVSYNDEFIYLFTKDLGLGPDPSFTSQDSDDRDACELNQDKHSGSSASNANANLKPVPQANANANLKPVPQAYKGHRNCDTVKGVKFFGPKCEYVVSGSDCGRIFIWKKRGGELIRVIEADKNVVNCIESHPHATVLASSGLEHDIKLWTPNSIDRAALPTNIQKDRVSNLLTPRIGFFTFGAFSDDDDDDDDDEDDVDFFDDEDWDNYYDDDDDDDDEGEEDIEADANIFDNEMVTHCSYDDYATNDDGVVNDHRGEAEEEKDEENDNIEISLLGNTDDSNDNVFSEVLYDGIEDEEDVGFLEETMEESIHIYDDVEGNDYDNDGWF